VRDGQAGLQQGEVRVDRPPRDAQREAPDAGRGQRRREDLRQQAIEFRPAGDLLEHPRAADRLRIREARIPCRATASAGVRVLRRPGRAGLRRHLLRTFIRTLFDGRPGPLGYPVGHGPDQQTQCPILHVAALDPGVVPTGDQTQAGDHDQRPPAAVAQRREGIDRGGGPVASALTVHAVGPPGEAVAAQVVGLVVGHSRRAERALAGDHLCNPARRARNRVGQGAGHRQMRVPLAEEALTPPTPPAQVEEAEPGVVAH
jgi:hypothetical protein